MGSTEPFNPNIVPTADSPLFPKEPKPLWYSVVKQLNIRSKISSLLNRNGKMATTTWSESSSSYNSDRGNRHTSIPAKIHELSKRRARNKFVENLEYLNIKMVALDFDNTIVSTHTCGTWSQGEYGIQKLAQYVRRVFVELIHALLANNFFVAVVSFSPQADLIRATLKLALIDDDSDKILIQCSTPDLLNSFPNIGGKENHLIAVASHIQKTYGQFISSRQILLIDDDMDNIMMALTYGHFVIHFNERLNDNLYNANIAYAA